MNKEKIIYAPQVFEESDYIINVILNKTRIMRTREVACFMEGNDRICCASKEAKAYKLMVEKIHSVHRKNKPGEFFLPSSYEWELAEEIMASAVEEMVLCQYCEPEGPHFNKLSIFADFSKVPTGPRYYPTKKEIDNYNYRQSLNVSPVTDEEDPFRRDVFIRNRSREIRVLCAMSK